ncbi:MAG TPA: glycosyltransferase [Bryobacteraceae bacterium]|nr:glycosyltransferase [Bryobacteraceae bacterium]
MHIAVLIPALRPGKPLLELVDALSRSDVEAIVLVNDGSGPEWEPIFQEARQFPKVHLLRHGVNLGKGAALKTGMSYVHAELPQCIGVVTADADGQHHPDDILNVARTLVHNPDRLVLGARMFDGPVPLRSRIGNSATRIAFRLLVGQKLLDTQTGLRGIPRGLMPDLLRISARGYEFELEMLLTAKNNGWSVCEQPIKTIYEPGNKSSHFNPLLDSVKTYAVLLRFTGVSILTALLDNLVFYLVYTHLPSVATSQLAARCVAIAFQYTAVRNAVFPARGRDRAMFPRFLLVALAQGLVSYAMIRGLMAAGMNIVFAKPLAEGLLFVVSFVLQREFVFTGQGDEARRTLHRTPKVAAWIVYCAVTLISVWGVFSTGVLKQPIWTSVGLKRLELLALWYAAWSVVLLLSARAWFASVTAAVLLVAFGAAFGPMPVAAVLFFLFSCFVTGALLLPAGGEADAASRLLQLLLGISVWMGILGIAVHFRVNYAATYLAAFVIPLTLRPRLTLFCLVDAVRLFGPLRLPQRSDYWAVVVGAFPLICHFLVVAKPEMGVDALAVHLMVPSWVGYQHYWPFDFHHFTWALTPLGADWCFTAVFLPGGEFAARLLNFAFFGLVASLVYTACRRYLSCGPAVLLAGLFASTPLVQLETGSLFAENLWAALLLGAVVALERFHATAKPRWLYAAAVFIGGGFATKFGTAAFFAPFALFAVWALWRRRKVLPNAARVAAVAACLVLVFGGPAYLYAWARTGNPAFPYMNQVFKSPWFDSTAPLVDPRWQLPTDWSTPYDLIYHSHQYLESFDGALGLQYLLLVALGFLALGGKRRYFAWLALGTSLVFWVLTFHTLSYLRYIYPALPLLTVAGAAGLARIRAWSQLLFRVALSTLLIGLALNVYLLPSSGYWHNSFFVDPFKRVEIERYFGDVMPERKAIEYLNRRHPGEPVAIFGTGGIAGLRAEPYVLGWHDPTYAPRATRATYPAAYGRLTQELGVKLFVSPAGDNPFPPPPVIAAFLKQYTEPEYTFRGFSVRRLKRGAEERWFSDTPQTIAGPCDAALVDDTAPSVQYAGAWRKVAGLGDACGGTIASANAAGAEATFRFNGASVTYLFARTFRSGMAEVDIDGAKRRILDLYAPAIEWRSRVTFDNLKPGVHALTVRALGGRRPESEGYDVTVDGFISGQ